MQIVEVKNNLVKISYDTSAENIVLSGFIIIKDELLSFIGQIVHLEANSNGNSAIVKLLFTFDDSGVITNYNGSIPNVKSPLDIVQPQELLSLLPVKSPIVIGELSQQRTLLKLDRSLLENKLLVCSEKEDDNYILIKNFVKQLVSGGKKVLVIDTNGGVNNSICAGNNDCQIIAGENFKLPLNYETINFIYEKGLGDATAESRALIQEIFLEVQNYVNTLPAKFIPFESFKDVVDAQYEELELVELVLLKNKLLKYYEAGIFAQEQKEFSSLKKSLEQKALTILNLSGVDENIQREMIAYAYSVVNQLGIEIYVIGSLENTNSDKKLLKQIFTTQNAYFTLICPYSYKYLKELKQLSTNLILFAPIQQQDDFAGYNTFLSKLNHQEFIIYGQATHHLPLIVTLDEIADSNLDNVTQPQEQVQVDEQNSQESLLDEEIKRDVDKIYTVPKVEESLEDDLTEDDLDFIDDLNIVEAGSTSEEFEEQEEISQHIENEFEEPEVVADNFEIVEEDEKSAFSNVLTQQATELDMEPPAVAPVIDILPVKMASTPIVPIYSAEIESKAQSDELEQGDTVTHSKYGKGTVEKLISYGSKTLCSINFDNVGRRLLDPTLAEIKKV